MLTGRLTRHRRRQRARSATPGTSASSRAPASRCAGRAAAGDEADGRAVRHGPHHRRSARAQPLRPSNARLSPFVRHARRSGAHRRRRRALPRMRTPHAIAAIGASARDRDATVFAQPAISVKLSALHPRYEYAAARARAAPSWLPRWRRWRADASEPRHRHDDRRRGSRAARAVARDLRARCAATRRSPDGTASASPCRRTRSARCAVVDWLVALAREVRPAHSGAAGQGRLLGHRDQARAGAGPRRLSGVHAQGAHRRLVPRLRAARCSERGGDALYPMFATHNAHTIAAIVACATQARHRRDFEFQRLHGMGEALYERDRAAGKRRHRLPRLRAGRQPSGPAALPGAAAARERRQHVVRQSHRRSARADRRHRRRPGCASARAWDCAPIRALPLPRDLFAPERRNSRGRVASPTSRRWRRSTRRSRASRATQLDRGADRWRAGASTGTARDVVRSRRPAPRRSAPSSTPIAPTSTARCRGASAAQPAWDARRRRRRAPRFSSAPPTCIEGATRRVRRAAGARGRQDARRCDRRSARGGGFLPLLRRCARDATSRGRWRCPRRPAKRTSSRCTAAACSRASARGIFRWRSSPARSRAALAAGNAVVAKPAEQTPLHRARAAVRMLLAAGVPRRRLALLPGAGETVGAALVADPRIAGVAFTGSTDVAQRDRARARRAHADRAADRRDRRPERDDRRQLRAARAGGRRRGARRRSTAPASAARRCACCSCRRTSRRASSSC